MKAIILPFVSLILLFFETSYSQDSIYLRKDTISGEILEIGLKTLKFKEETMPVTVIRRNDILKLQYSNGKIEDFGSNNPRKIKPLSLGILLSDFIFEEMVMAEVDMNYFLKPYFSFNPSIGADINGNIYLNVGPRFYFNRLHSSHKFVPFIGFQIGIAYTLGFVDEAGFCFKTPFGLDYITTKGFNFALEMCPITVTNYSYGGTLVGIKFGKNF